MAERDPRYKADLRERAEELYSEGLSVRGVADALGVSKTRVTQILDEAGVKLRPRGRPVKNPDAA